MKISKLRLIVVATIILGITWSCEKDEEITPPNEDNHTNQSSPEGMIRLGAKLENPYSVENMKIAWGNLKTSNANARISGEELQITTTHLYLKWKPKNNEELFLLKIDSTIDFYEYPLDYELIEGGTHYHDPTVAEGQPTYLYCALPVTKELPKGVEYEVLAELFIPDEEKNVLNRKSSSVDINFLVEEALRITGNLEETQNYTNARITASSWRPAGRIQVFDDVTNNMRPLEGVEIKARRWFTTHKGRTNAQGYYSCDGTFKRDANYSLDWERYDFSLREGWLNGANINGPKKKGDWNQDFMSGKSMFHARVFMAAYHYYYKDIKGLRRPPQNGVWKTQMHIRCYNEKNENVNGRHKEERRFLGLGSQIKIYNPQNDMRSIYATTIHELAHASHWNMWRKGEDFDDSDKIVKESWARGVEWELTRMIYVGYVPDYSRSRYTGVVQDMIDGNKTTVSKYYFTDSDHWVESKKFYKDQVGNYTIRQIEDALQSKKTWNDWRDNIKNKYNNATENNLDTTFNHWSTN